MARIHHMWPCGIVRSFISKRLFIQVGLSTTNILYLLQTKTKNKKEVKEKDNQFRTTTCKG